MTLGLLQADNLIYLGKGLLRSLFLFMTGSLRPCRVVGSSMEPNLYQGDFIFYRPIKEKDIPIKKGTIVVFNHPIEANTLAIKRVHKSSDFGIELRGDNEKISIDSRQYGTVNQTNMLGIVEKIIPIKNRKSD